MRIKKLLSDHAKKISSVHVTLDSHAATQNVSHVPSEVIQEVVMLHLFAPVKVATSLGTARPLLIPLPQTLNRVIAIDRCFSERRR